MISSPGSPVSRRATPPVRATAQMSPAYTKAIESRDRVGKRKRRVDAVSSVSAAPGAAAGGTTMRAQRMMKTAYGTRRIAGSSRLSVRRVFYPLIPVGVKPPWRAEAAPGGAPAGHGSGLLRKPPLASPCAAHRAEARAAGPRRKVSDGPADAPPGAAHRRARSRRGHTAERNGMAGQE